MTNMKVALHDGKGKMHIKEIRRPTLGERDALIQVRSTGICGSDLLNYAENLTFEIFPGGHEVSGEIVEVGKAVDSSRIGERVAVETIGQGLNCKDCWFCRQGQFRQCSNKALNEGGGFAEYIKRRADGCYPISESMEWQEGALVEPLAVSIHALRRGLINSGDTVVVLGSGTIGLTAVAAARAMGAGTILATSRHKHQATMAKALGADYTFSPDDDEFIATVLEMTDGRGADLTLETVGGSSQTILDQAIEVTRMQGRISILGGFHVPITLDWMKPLLKEHTIYFSSCYSVINGRHDFEMAIDFLSSTLRSLNQIVTHTVSLENIQKGFEIASNKTSGSIKVQILQ